MNKDCPHKAKYSVKAIEDGPLAAVTSSDLLGFFGSINAITVDDEGYTEVKSKKKLQGRTVEPSGGVTGAIGVLSFEAAAGTPNRGSPLHGGHIGIRKFN